MKRLIVLAAVALLGAAPPPEAVADYLGNIRVDPPATAFLHHSVPMTVQIDYEITDPGGGYIQVVPYASGVSAPSAYYLSSPLVPPGSGTVTRQCGVDAGTVLVNQILVQLLDPDGTTPLAEVLVPCHVKFAEHGVYNLTYSHTNGSWLANGDWLTIDFDHASDNDGIVRISIRPFTDGALTPGYAAGGVAIVPPVGSGSQSFTFNSGDRTVDHLRIQMRNEDGSVLLMEAFVPVRYGWQQIGIANWTVTPAPPASLALLEWIRIDFDYSSPLDFTAALYPCRGGDYLDGGYTYSYPGPVAAGTGASYTRVRIDSGERDLDELRLALREAYVPGDPLYLHSLPGDYHVGPHAIENIVAVPAAPAILTNGTQAGFTFDYVTDCANDVLIYVRPLSGGVRPPNVQGHGSDDYPTGTGSGSGWFTITSGDVEVDALEFWMEDAATREVLLTWIEPTRLLFGSSGTVTGAPASEPPDSPRLAQNYPNPFNPATVIPFDLGREAQVRLRVFDLRGRVVATLLDGVLPAGRHEAPFRAVDLPAGSYLYALEVSGRRLSGRMTLVK